MGGFYGSVQVRTEERPKVLAAADAVAKALNIRCLIGPNLDGWVGVYPEGSGQDRTIGESIAKDVGGEVLHILVHDDDVMAYWFWLNGDLVDSYWSSPGYFNKLDARVQERMAGDPLAFGAIVEGKSQEFLDILKREHHDYTMEATRLQRFMELLKIRNGVTSYEYLKAGERMGIDGWEEFDEVPADAVAAERAMSRQRTLEITRKKQQLRKEWILLADVVEDRLLPRAGAVGDGMLLAWEGFGRGEARIEFFRPPWGEAEPGEIETGGQVERTVRRCRRATRGDGAGKPRRRLAGQRLGGRSSNSSKATGPPNVPSAPMGN